MKMLTVLFLDSFNAQHLFNMMWQGKVGTPIEVVSIPGDPYGFHPDTLRGIEAMTSDPNNGIDVIVIGNNLEAGIKKAAAVAESMRSKVVVVWHDYHPSQEDPYRELGISHFGERLLLPELIQAMIEAE